MLSEHTAINRVISLQVPTSTLQHSTDPPNVMHCVEAICSQGTADRYNTEASERIHIDYTKEGYHASNKNYNKQLTVWRQEAVTQPNRRTHFPHHRRQAFVDHICATGSWLWRFKRCSLTLWHGSVLDKCGLFLPFQITCAVVTTSQNTSSKVK